MWLWPVRSSLFNFIQLVYISVELKLLLRSSVKSKVDKSKSMEIVFGGLLTLAVFSVKILLHRSNERLVDGLSSGSDEVEINLSSSWESVDTVDSVDCLRSKVSRFGLDSIFPWESFLRFRALKPMSSTISYFSNPPHSADKRNAISSHSLGFISVIILANFIENVLK